MAEKRYYWLKLQEDFFSSLRIKKLRKIAGGDTYTIIYLKMQLLSIRNGGILKYSGLESSFAEELALDLDEEVENVAVTLQYLLSCGLIETSDNIEYLLPFAVANTGSEGSSAQRVREFRERQKVLQSNDVVTPVKQIGNGEIDIEIEKDIDRELDIPPYNPPKGEADAEKKTVETSHGKTVDTQGKTLETQFDRFWKVYPKHVGKDAARKAFKRVVEKRSVSVETLIAAVEKQKSWQQWTKDNGQYIPNASTWLNQARWEDEQYSNMDAVRKQYTTKGSFFDDD